MGEKARAEWRTGWPLVLSAAVGVAVAGMDLYGLGAFVQPLEHEFGWSRGQITAGPAIASTVFLAGAPSVGILLDRYSTRAVAIPGFILYCAAFALLSRVGPNIVNWFALWALLGVGASGISVTVWSLAIGRRFSASRGLALGIAMTGTGLCSAVMPPTAGLLINQHGWRFAFCALGIGALALTLPLLLLGFRDAAGTGHSMTGAGGLRNPARRVSGIGARRGFASRLFWAIASSGFLVVTGTIALAVHFVPILTQQGVPRDSALFAAALIGVTSIASRCCSGYLLDHLPGRFVGAVAFSLPTFACVILLQTRLGNTAALAAAGIIGVSLGTEVEVLAYLTSRYFGLLGFGVLFGAINILLKVGVGLGPVVGGVIYDTTGQYRGFIAILVVAFLASALSLLTLGDYPALPETTLGSPNTSPVVRE